MHYYRKHEYIEAIKRAFHFNVANSYTKTETNHNFKFQIRKIYASSMHG